jgi:hypothetical protein
LDGHRFCEQIHVNPAAAAEKKTPLAIETLRQRIQSTIQRLPCNS